MIYDFFGRIFQIYIYVGRFEFCSNIYHGMSLIWTNWIDKASWMLLLLPLEYTLTSFNLWCGCCDWDCERIVLVKTNEATVSMYAIRIRTSTEIRKSDFISSRIITVTHLLRIITNFFWSLGALIMIVVMVVVKLGVLTSVCVIVKCVFGWDSNQRAQMIKSIFHGQCIDCLINFKWLKNCDQGSQGLSVWRMKVWDRCHGYKI